MMMSIVQDKKIEHMGRTDFGWDGKRHNDFRKTDVYASQETTVFGISAYSESDSVLVFPILDRMLKNGKTASKNRYRDAATFCRMNVNTAKVESVFGHFPQLYREKSMPQMEFLQFDVHDDTLYVNHSADSLIYVYEYLEHLLYTMGYDCDGINRDYPEMSPPDWDATSLENDGMNSGLRYCSQNKTLCRTYVKSFSDKTDEFTQNGRKLMVVQKRRFDDKELSHINRIFVKLKVSTIDPLLENTQRIHPDCDSHGCHFLQRQPDEI